MINYIIAAFLSIIVIFIGYYLGKITKEELAGFFDYFNYSLTVLSSAMIFMIMFFAGVNIPTTYILVIMFSIFHLFSMLWIRIGLSIFIYFFSSLFLVIYLDFFLLGSAIILGFLIGSVYYYILNKKNI